MLCYKDMTFCSSQLCVNTDCFRHRVHHMNAPKDFPIAQCDFEKNCTIYLGPTRTEQGPIQLQPVHPFVEITANGN